VAVIETALTRLGQEDRKGGGSEELSPDEIGQLVEKLDQLMDYLKKNDLEAEEEAEALAKRLDSTQFHDSMNGILTYLDEFDFTAALEEAARLKKLMQEG
jgi:hypothetical protein